MSRSNTRGGLGASRSSTLVRLAAVAFGMAGLFVSTAEQALACACGCGVFDVGGVSFAPTNSDTGASVFFRYDFMNQRQNFEGTSKAPSADNQDKKITTAFYTLGGQYMFNHDWGIMVELPLYARSFTTTTDSGVGTFNLNALGDLKLMGMYTGFSPDHSTGITFGLKLPTGVWHSPTYGDAGQVYDRDTLPGTGSTDLVLGAYHIGSLTSDGKLNYFVQGSGQIPFAIQAGYRPGAELNTAVGLSYDMGSYGPATTIAPVAQVIGSFRARDIRMGAPSYDSGYERLLVSPGLDVRFGKAKLYLDVELPVYQRVNHGSLADAGTSGQLVAPVLTKVQFGYDF